MEGGDNKFVNVTVPTLKAFLKAHSQKCVWQQAITCCSCYRMAKNNNNVFFPRTRDLLVSRKTMQRHFSPHSSSPFPCNFCKRNSNGIFNDSQSWFSFHFYTQRELKPTEKSARKWQLRPFATSCAKYYEGHSPLQTSFTEPPIRKDLAQKVGSHSFCGRFRALQSM